MSKKGTAAQLAFGAMVEPDFDPAEHWQGMPEYTQEDLAPVAQIIVSFATNADVIAFARLLGVPTLITERSTWFPPRKQEAFRLWAFTGSDDEP